MRVVDQTAGQLTVRIDLALYSEAAAFKWLYWLGGRFDAEVEREPDGQSLKVSLKPLRLDAPTPNWEVVAPDLRRSLIDFQTRQIVTEETRAIRELIVAKALDALDPLPIPPPGDLSDPVGFHPSDFDEPDGK